MNIMNRKKLDLAGRYILCAFLLCLLVYNTVLIFSNKVFMMHVNSDGVGELSYLQATWEHKSFFPENFMHSGEAFANRPVLLFWLFYGISKNLILSSQWTCFSCLLLQLATLAFLLKSLNTSIESILFAVSMYLVWVPRSLAILFYIHMIAYADFVILVFLIMALYIQLGKRTTKANDLKNRKTVVVLLLNLIIAAMVGFTTTRFAAVIYLPLFIVNLIRLFLEYLNDHNVSFKKLAMTISCFAFFLVNVTFYALLLKLHGNVFQPPAMVLRAFGDWDFKTTITAFIQALGLEWGGSVKSAEGLKFLLCACYLLLGLFSVGWIIAKKVEDHGLAVLWCVSTIVVFLESLMVGYIANRYWFLTTVLLPALVGVALNDWSKQTDGSLDHLPCCLLSMGLLGIFCFTIKSDITTYSAPLPVLTQVAEYIKDNGYKYVTASGWNAAVIKGYTNGAVEYQHDLGGVCL